MLARPGDFGECPDGLAMVTASNRILRVALAFAGVRGL